MSTRYPLAALMEATGLSEAALGRRVGLSGSSLVKARELGLVDKAADRCAVRAGLLPWQVWPSWLDDAQTECAADDCTTRFFPRTKTHLFCSRTCCQRMKMRRYRSTDKGKLENRYWRMRWYAECRDYDLAASRRRRERLRAEREAAA